MTVLVVEDDPAIRLLLVHALEGLSMLVLTARTIEEARTLPRPDVIVSDWSFPDGHTPRELQVGVPIVIVSGHKRPDDWTGQWVSKPMNRDDLQQALTTAIGMAGT